MDIREELVCYYQWLRQYGLNDSHSGNASVRDQKRVWVTPTGACADTLTVNDLIACDLMGTPGPGASLDAPLHLEVYRKNPQATAILHSHGAHSVALTMDGKDFVPPDFEGAYYFGTVPVLCIDFKNYTQESPTRVAQTLAQNPVTIVRGHGVYAWGETLNQAYKWTCTLELSAKTTFIARQAGTIPCE